MDHRSSGCSPAEKFPTCASGRQGRGAVTLLIPVLHFSEPRGVILFRKDHGHTGSCSLRSGLFHSAEFSRLGLMSQMEKKTLSAPDEKRSFDKGQVELVTLGGVTFGRATLQPGWKWSTCVKPIVNTESCQAPHLQYHVSGRLRVRMDDGSEDEFGPGECRYCLLATTHGSWGMNRS